MVPRTSSGLLGGLFASWRNDPGDPETSEVLPPAWADLTAWSQHPVEYWVMDVPFSRKHRVEEDLFWSAADALHHLFQKIRGADGKHRHLNLAMVQGVWTLLISFELTDKRKHYVYNHQLCVNLLAHEGTTWDRAIGDFARYYGVGFLDRGSFSVMPDEWWQPGGLAPHTNGHKPSSNGPITQQGTRWEDLRRLEQQRQVQAPQSQPVQFQFIPVANPPTIQTQALPAGYWDSTP